jgi:isoamylase
MPGATWTAEGTNFVFSRSARRVELLVWHGVRLNEPAWHDGACQFLAFTIAGLDATEPDLHVILNMADAAVSVPRPPIPGRAWFPVADTAEPATAVALPAQNQHPSSLQSWPTQPRSVVIFEGRLAPV